MNNVSLAIKAYAVNRAGRGKSCRTVNTLIGVSRVINITETDISLCDVDVSSPVTGLTVSFYSCNSVDLSTGFDSGKLCLLSICIIIGRQALARDFIDLVTKRDNECIISVTVVIYPVCDFFQCIKRSRSVMDKRIDPTVDRLYSRRNHCADFRQVNADIWKVGITGYTITNL